MKYYSYEQFKIDTKKIIQKSPQIDAILGIARGGLTLSHALAEGLDLREVQTLRTELYDNTTKRNTITIIDTTTFTSKQKVLVVDDIADSGETLNVVMQHLKHKYPQTTFISATLFYKTSSSYEPDIWINEASQWIEFFWEKDFN